MVKDVKEDTHSKMWSSPVCQHVWGEKKNNKRPSQAGEL